MVDNNDANAESAPTLADTSRASTDPAVAATLQPDIGDPAAVELAPSGYQLGVLIGKGGMGEIIAAQDRRIGRDVAYKRLRSADASADALSRFMREARIQARLDHPAIVPVYEVGKDADGRPFFTMKRLSGKTLAERLQDRSESLLPLLRAFTEVALAIELAHTKGVVHRDLKPANIMLGDYGEVYVLDWGVARVMSERARAPSGADPDGEMETLGDATHGGTLLGTLGYMAPEQIRGEPVDGRADVYALGSILFEILAGEPLHPRGHAAIASTLAMESASPSKRKPDRVIAPELDELCAEMLDAKRDDRPTAHQVAQRVQKYLDGDRDLEARRELANEYLEAARDELASGDPKRRVDALRAAGRALALDPRSGEAADLVTGLIVEPPKELPDELVEKLDEQEAALIKARARRAAAGYLSLLSLSVCLVFFKIASWPWLIAIYAGIAMFVIVSLRAAKTGRANIPAILIGTGVLAVLFGRAASPLMLVPTLLCGTMVSVSNIPFLNDRPKLFYGWIIACGTLPLVFEWGGVLSATTLVTANAIEVRSAIFSPSGWVALPVLAVANAVLLLIVARFTLLVAADRRRAQKRLTIQAWHLGQLLPETPEVIAAPTLTLRR
jgi:eukaryotic-like serine/threonine-protein kinase